MIATSSTMRKQWRPGQCRRSRSPTAARPQPAIDGTPAEAAAQPGRRRPAIAQQRDQAISAPRTRSRRRQPATSNGMRGGKSRSTPRRADGNRGRDVDGDTGRRRAAERNRRRGGERSRRACRRTSRRRRPRSRRCRRGRRRAEAGQHASEPDRRHRERPTPVEPDSTPTRDDCAILACEAAERNLPPFFVFDADQCALSRIGRSTHIRAQLDLARRSGSVTLA